MHGDGRDSGVFGCSGKYGIIWHNRRQRRSDGDMDDNETFVEQGLSAGDLMRRLTDADYSIDAVTAEKALLGAWLCRRLGHRLVEGR